MALIATLNTVFTAETSKFDAGVGKAQGGLGKFRNSVSGSLTSMVPFGRHLSLLGPAALGLAAGIGVVVVGIKAFKAAIDLAAKATEFFIDRMQESFTSLDKLAKQSKRTGVAVASLQAFTLAAGFAGANTDNLDKSIVKMQRTIIDASVGVTTAKRAFDDLKIPVKELLALDTEGQLRRIAKGFGELNNDAIESSAAMTIFSRNGAELIPLFESGTAEIDRARATLDKWGVSINDRNLPAVEQFNDKVSELQTVFAGLFQQIALELAPYAVVAINDLSDAMQAFSKIFGEQTSIAEVFEGTFIAIAAIAKELEQSTLFQLKAIRFATSPFGASPLDPLIESLEKAPLDDFFTRFLAKVRAFQEELKNLQAERLAKEEQDRLAMERRIIQESFMERLSNWRKIGEELLGIEEKTLTGRELREGLLGAADRVGGVLSAAGRAVGRLFDEDAIKKAAPDVGALQRGSVAEFQARQIGDRQAAERTAKATEGTEDKASTMVTELRSISRAIAGGLIGGV